MPFVTETLLAGDPATTFVVNNEKFLWLRFVIIERKARQKESGPKNPWQKQRKVFAVSSIK